MQQEDDGKSLTENAPLYLLADGLGSVRVEMTGGNATATTSYGPYGSIHQQTGTSQTSYGYTGEQFHAGTGLLYLRARYYNPTLHQFMAKDPFNGWDALPASQNGYSYVHGNPINMIDPSGQIAICFDGGHVSLKWSSRVASGAGASNFLQVCEAGLRQGGYTGQIYRLENMPWDKAVAIESIKNADTANEPILIVGYSWGGAAALEAMAELSAYLSYPPYPAPQCTIDDPTDALNYAEENLSRGTIGSAVTSTEIDLLFLIDPELALRQTAPRHIYGNVRYSVNIQATNPTAKYDGSPPLEYLQDGSDVSGASEKHIVEADHHTIVNYRFPEGKYTIQLLRTATAKAIQGSP